MLSYIKEELLTKCKNYKIETATNFIEAIMISKSYIKQNKEFDVIISNYNMTKIKGDAVLRQLNEIFPNSIKILIFDNIKDEIKNYLEYSINNLFCIEKPIIIENIYSLIKEKVMIYG
jgi:response regulator RpfG family c-di-GMP phosphodiesterase